MNDQHPLPEVAQQLAVDLARARPMRRGSLSARYMKCGHVNCRCQQDPEARHGPYFSLTRGAGGTTRSRYLSEEQAVLARTQIEAGQKFRRQVDAFWDACERWADAELEASETASQLEAEKGGSKRRLRRKSSAKSKR
jgi:hypothetical protein